MGSLENGILVGVSAFVGAFSLDCLIALQIHDPTFPYQTKKLVADLVVGVIGFGAGAALTRK